MNNFDDILNNAPVKEQSDVQLSKEEYAEKKKVEREEMFALSDNIAIEIAGNGKKFKKYLDMQSKFDRYSAVNTLLIMAQNPEATRIGDFDYWKNQGGYVKQQQTAISILEPHGYTKEDGSPGTGYNIKKVFDISQVDARKVRQTHPPTYTERQILSALIHKAPMKISGVDELPNNLCAMTDPQTGDISVRKGMDFIKTFSSLAQNIAASELPESNVSQIESGFLECCVSYILCKKYDIDTEAFRFDDAPDIFDDMDAQTIKSVISQVRDAAANICGRMSQQLEAVQKAAKSQEAR